MPDLAAVLLRFSLYAVLGLLFGLLAFRQYSPAGTNAAGGHRTVVGLAILGFFVSALAMVELAARMHGLNLADVGIGEIATILSLPGVGSAFIVRMAALLGTMTIMLVQPGRGRMALIGAGAALVSLAWQGHAAATDGRAGTGHLLATVLHLLAAGVWLGALAGLLGLSIEARRSQSDHGRFAGAVASFHGVGTLVVVTLAITGSVSFFVIVGWPFPVMAFQSPWWWLLAIKLALFIGMLGLAAANRFRLAPRLAAGHQQAVGRIRGSIALEVVMALLILALVAWLGMLAPDPG